MHERKNRYLVILLSILLFIPFLGDKSFYTRGEAREALATQSVFDGSHILPRGYGNVVASKPPALQWLGALTSLSIGRVNEFAARFPSALASVVFISTLFFFLETRFGYRTAIMTACILMTSLEWFRLSGTARVDMLNTVFICGAIISMYLFYEEKKYVQGFLIVLFLIGATLTKGPVGIILFAGISLLYLFLRRKNYFCYGKLILLCALSALISSLWYLKAYQVGGEEFFQTIFRENFSRFNGSMPDAPHRATFFYLYATLIVGFIPWIILLLPEWISLKVLPWISSYRAERSILGAAESKQKRIRRDVKNIAHLMKQWWAKRDELPPLKLLSYCVIVVVLGFYALPEGKRSVYLLPAYPFISFLLAQYFLRSNARSHSIFGKSLFSFACSIIVISIGLTMCIMLAPLFTNIEAVRFVNDLLQYGINHLSLIKMVILILPFIFSLYFIIKFASSYRRSVLPFAINIFFVTLLSIQAVWAPMYSEALSSEGFAQALSRDLPENAPLYSYKYEFYGISFYSQKRFQTKNENFAPGDFILLYEKNLPSLQNDSKLNFETILRSQKSIDIPEEYVVLVKLKI